MIRAVLFDLDGVLVETRDLHYRALNAALQSHGAVPITPVEHADEFNGLPTSTKLDRLVKYGRVRPEDIASIQALKQKETRRLLETEVTFDPNVYCLLAGLIRLDMSLAVVSNAVRDTVEVVLRLILGRPAWNFFEWIVTPGDSPPKPNGAMYLRAASLVGVSPSECLAVEDGEYGVRAATEAGCRVLRVAGPQEVTPKRIWEALC